MSGMKNINFKYLYRRTEQLLMVPETVWPEALNETNSGKELYRNYLIPITMVISIMVLLINLINYNFWQATGLTIINLIAMLIGNWFAYLITREYLCRKLSFDTNLALNLTVYSGWKSEYKMSITCCSRFQSRTALDYHRILPVFRQMGVRFKNKKGELIL